MTAQASSTISFFPANLGGLLNTGPPAAPVPPNEHASEHGNSSTALQQAEPQLETKQGDAEESTRPEVDGAEGARGMDGWGDDNIELQLTPASTPEKETVVVAPIPEPTAKPSHPIGEALEEPTREDHGDGASNAADVQETDPAVVSTHTADVTTSLAENGSAGAQVPLGEDNTKPEVAPERGREAAGLLPPADTEEQPITPSRVGMLSEGTVQMEGGSSEGAVEVSQANGVTAESQGGELHDAEANGMLHTAGSTGDSGQYSTALEVQNIREQMVLVEQGAEEEGPSPREGGGNASEAGSLENVAESVASAASHVGASRDITPRATPLGPPSHGVQPPCSATLV